MVKKVILIIIALFLGYQSIKMTQLIIEVEINSIWLILFLSFLVNLFVMGCSALLGFALPTQSLLPASYYAISHPKRLTFIFNLLQVSLFRKFLLATFWRKQKLRKGHFSGVKSGLEQLEVQSKKAEFGHLIPFVALSGLSLYLLFINFMTFTLFILLLNVIGNLYPILLQRNHRLRLQKIYSRNH